MPVRDCGVRRSKGFLIVVSASSGVGKTTLVREIQKRVDGLVYSISVTTRPRLLNERDGVDYFFVSEDEFDVMIREGKFLEWATVYGHRYGTPRKFIEECTQACQDVILDIDIEGARQIRKNWPDMVSVFLLPPSAEELKRRLLLRGRDTPESIKARLSAVSREVEALRDYDYTIVNDNLEEALRKLEAIIVAERLKVTRCKPDEFIAEFQSGIRGSLEPEHLRDKI